MNELIFRFKDVKCGWGEFNKKDVYIYFSEGFLDANVHNISNDTWTQYRFKTMRELEHKLLEQYSLKIDTVNNECRFV